MNKKIIYLILFFVTALFIINSCKETNVVGIIDEESGNEENYYTLNVSKQGTGSGLIKSYPKGINCGEMCSNLFLNNTYVKLTAIGISSSTHNSSFYKWSGACTGNKTCALKMNSDKQAIAVFNIINTTIANYNLNVNVFGNGTGYVTSSPIGINCGTYGTGLLNCSKNYVNNTHVKLIAIGISNSTHNSSFYKWSGACTGYYNSFCTININSNKNVIAEFYSRKFQTNVTINQTNTTIANYNLNVNVFGNGTGYVTSSPIGINCGTYGTGLLNCSKNYVNNTHVKLIAIGISNSTHNSSFYKWSGACTGYYNSFCTININSNKNVIAEFYSRKL